MRAVIDRIIPSITFSCTTRESSAHSGVHSLQADRVGRDPKAP